MPDHGGYYSVGDRRYGGMGNVGEGAKLFCLCARKGHPSPILRIGRLPELLMDESVDAAVNGVAEICAIRMFDFFIRNGRSDRPR